MAKKSRASAQLRPVRKKPGVHHVPALPVVDAVVGAQAQQEAGVPLAQPQGKGDAKNVLPVDGLVLAGQPAAHPAAGRFGAEAVPLPLEGGGEPGLEGRPGVELAQRLPEVPHADPPVPEVFRGHGRGHLAGADVVVRLSGLQG